MSSDQIDSERVWVLDAYEDIHAARTEVQERTQARRAAGERASARGQGRR